MLTFVELQPGDIERIRDAQSPGLRNVMDRLASLHLLLAKPPTTQQQLANHQAAAGEAYMLHNRVQYIASTN